LDFLCGQLGATCPRESYVGIFRAPFALTVLELKLLSKAMLITVGYDRDFNNDFKFRISQGQPSKIIGDNNYVQLMMDSMVPPNLNSQCNWKMRDRFNEIDI
jgi:hypothetical protein